MARAHKISTRDLYCHDCESVQVARVANKEGYWYCLACDATILCDHCGEPWAEEDHDGGEACAEQRENMARAREWGRAMGGSTAMSAQHTPGPWRVDPQPPETGEWWIWGGGSPGSADEYGIAATHDLNPCAEADARLIAAAPDLLATLFAVRDALDDDGVADDEGREELSAEVYTALAPFVEAQE